MGAKLLINDKKVHEQAVEVFFVHVYAWILLKLVI